MEISQGVARVQVERILQSDSFLRSESLRRLLSYLADRSLADDADRLKEYAIGMDVFGKSKDYDTRLDAGVRIQVSRLRQKLADYYATDGTNDEIVVSLPKGQFKLLFEAAAPGAAVQPDDRAESSAQAVGASGETGRRRVSMILAVALVVVFLWAGISSIALHRAQQRLDSEPRWSEAMETFWHPFVQDNRPLVMAVGAPLLIGLRGCCFYRDLNNNNVDEAEQAPGFRALRKALKDPGVFAVHPYTGVGQAKSMLLLGALLGRRLPKMSFARSSDLSWQQLSESNALFVGSARTFGQLLSALPVKAEMMMEDTGLRVLHPAQGEPAFLADPTVAEVGDDANAGEVHALISVLPGPNGRGFVGSFSASLGPESLAASGAEGIAASLGAGSLAAVEYVTDPASVAELIGRLRDKNGRVPKYFQVALSVRFKGGIPTGSRYLLSRELRVEQTVAKKATN